MGKSRKGNRPWKLLVIAAFFLSCAACSSVDRLLSSGSSLDASPSWQPESTLSMITVDAEIKSIWADGRFCYLTVWSNEKEYQVVVQDQTIICSQNGDKLDQQSLIIGKDVELIVDPLVIYEPVETFQLCYKIIVF